MRLTLRNLLRFLDQTNLRSIERSRLEELVDQSEKADAWIKRIDALKRSSQVAAPPIECTEQTVNRVAAYLDSTIGEEGTIGFEQTMLSSDELLAEVASCHEIRETLRVENNVSIPILLRQSVYDLGRDLTRYDQLPPEKQEDEATEEKNVAALAASMEDLPYVDSNPDDPHPIGGVFEEEDELDEETVSLDSLSHKAQRRSQIVMAVLITILLGMLALSYELGRQAGMFSRELPGNPQMAGLDNPDNDDKEATPKDTAGREKANDDIDKAEDFDKASEEDSDKASEGESSENETDPAGDEPTTDTEPPAEGPDFAGMLPLAPLPSGEETPDEAGNTADTDLPKRPDIAAANSETSEPAREALPIATIPDADSILLQREPAQQTWVRSPNNSALVEGTEIIVLAGTTAGLDLSGNLVVTVHGPARFTIGQRDVASGADVINVQHGKFSVVSSVDDMDLLFDRNTRRYRLTIPVTGSRTTAQFTRYLPSGDDPRSIEPALIDLFIADQGRVSLTAGEATWLLPESTAMIRSVSANVAFARDPMTGMVTLPLPQARDYTVRLKETVGKNFADLPQELQAGKSLQDFLVSLKSNVRQERRFAAVSWLASIGNYAYLVDFLNDEKNRNNWRSAIESVHASILNHPDHSNALFESLSVAGEAERDIMYKLIQGYTQQELEAGDDKTLVGYLDHDSLCVRVLAIERIRHITGGLAYGYTPNADRKSRRRTIKNQWEKALKKGDLRYREPPKLPLPEFTTVAPDPADEDQTGKDAGDAGGIN